MNVRKSREEKKFALCHLKQLHKHPLPDTFTEHPLLQSMIVNSQRQIAEYLLKHNPDFIISEGIETSLSLETIPKEIITQIRASFPNGLPKYDSDLTWDQKKCFYECHADIVTVALGVVKKIYPATNETENLSARAVLMQQQMIMNYIDVQHKKHERLLADQSITDAMKEAAIKEASNELAELQDVFERQNKNLFSPREKSAIDNLKAAVDDESKINNKSCYNAVVIFGGGHDFKPICESEGIVLSEVYTYDQAGYERISRQISSARATAKRFSLNLFESDLTDNQKLDIQFAQNKQDQPLSASLQKYLNKETQQSKKQGDSTDSDNVKRHPKIC